LAEQFFERVERFERLFRRQSIGIDPPQFIAQRRIEAADTVPFETFRQQYLSPVLLS